LARDHCPVRELPAWGKAFKFGKESDRAVRKKGLDVTEDILILEDEDLEDLVESDELLVEGVSIDGMCGVY
jgi:mycofactocin precursor